jgi:hypothetical protein
LRAVRHRWCGGKTSDTAFWMIFGFKAGSVRTWTCTICTSINNRWFRPYF